MSHRIGTGKNEIAIEKCISELGASNQNVLAGITVNAAKLCGIDGKTGSISEGLAADMVVLEGNPLEDINALKKVVAVYQDGRNIANII